MHKRKALLLSLVLFIFLSSFASAVDITLDDDLSETDIQAGLTFGPGSKVPLFCPIYPGAAWTGATSEPKIARWTIYDPYIREVTTFEHVPSYKQQISGKWDFADRTAFTIPAFASKGTWLASVEFEFEDGTKFQGYFGDTPNIIYQSIVVTQEDWFASMFTAPWYFLGFQLPAYFWFPGFIIWVPLIYIAVCAIFSRSIGGFVDVTRSAASAARKARGKKKRRIKK